MLIPHIDSEIFLKLLSMESLIFLKKKELFSHVKWVTVDYSTSDQLRARWFISSVKYKISVMLCCDNIDTEQ